MIVIHKGNVDEFLRQNPYVQLVHCSHHTNWWKIKESGCLKPGCEVKDSKKNVKNAIMFSLTQAFLGKDVSGAKVYDRLHFFLKLKYWCEEYSGVCYIQTTCVGQVLTNIPLPAVKVLNTYLWKDMQEPHRPMSNEERQYLRKTNEAQADQHKEWDLNVAEHNRYNQGLPIAPLHGILKFAYNQAKPKRAPMLDTASSVDTAETVPAPKRMPMSLAKFIEAKKELPDGDTGSLDPIAPMPEVGTVKDKVARYESNLKRKSVWDKVEHKPTEIPVRRVTNCHIEKKGKRKFHLTEEEEKERLRTDGENVDRLNKCCAGIATVQSLSLIHI